MYSYLRTPVQILIISFVFILFVQTNIFLFMFALFCQPNMFIFVFVLDMAHKCINFLNISFNIYMFIYIFSSLEFVYIFIVANICSYIRICIHIFPYFVNTNIFTIAQKNIPTCSCLYLATNFVTHQANTFTSCSSKLVKYAPKPVLTIQVKTSQILSPKFLRHPKA